MGAGTVDENSSPACMGAARRTLMRDLGPCELGLCDLGLCDLGPLRPVPPSKKGDDPAVVALGPRLITNS
jgi:hypothetical protein